MIASLFDINSAHTSRLCRLFDANMQSSDDYELRNVSKYNVEMFELVFPFAAAQADKSCSIVQRTSTSRVANPWLRYLH